MIKRSVFFCLISFGALIIACAHDTVSLQIDKNLPAEKLARYNDSFDSLREDIWGKVESFFRVSMKINFKEADVINEGGKLKIETKTGFFSRGGILSKFYFKGDFDVQVDCYVEFSNDIGDMDQAISFVASDNTTELEDDKLETVLLGINKSGKNPVFIHGGYREKGNMNTRYRRQIGDIFNGTLRILRIGNQIILLYATQPDGKWQTACSFSRPSNRTSIHFKAQNYFPTRVSIDAKAPVTAYFDNFKINAAQEIIEDEI